MTEWRPRRRLRPVRGCRACRCVLRREPSGVRRRGRKSRSAKGLELRQKPRDISMPLPPPTGFRPPFWCRPPEDARDQCRRREGRGHKASRFQPWHRPLKSTLWDCGLRSRLQQSGRPVPKRSRMRLRHRHVAPRPLRAASPGEDRPLKSHQVRNLFPCDPGRPYRGCPGVDQTRLPIRRFRCGRWIGANHLPASICRIAT